MCLRAAAMSVLLSASILLLPQASSKAVSNESVAAKPALYWVCNSTICGLLVNAGDNSSEAAPDATLDHWSVISSAKHLPLRKCRYPLHVPIALYKWRYTFLSNITDGVSPFHGRNFTLTFCVKAHCTIRFSCCRARDQNDERYWRDIVLIRKPVGLRECARAFEMLDYAYLPLFRAERLCATFLTVSSCGVRTQSGECVRLSRYALFSGYTEVWNDCMRYTDDATWNFSYNSQFGATPEPRYFPTQEEVSRCGNYATRVACSKTSLNSRAGLHYFYAGHDVGELRRSKTDEKSCCLPNTDDYASSDSADRFHFTSYKNAAPIRGIGGGLAFSVLILKIFGRLYCYGLFRIQPKTPRMSRKRGEPVSFINLSSGAIPLPPPPPPTTGGRRASHRGLRDQLRQRAVVPTIPFGA